jgi:pyruvate formate-lyase/glycerol dehydratase family glycyl radical enzyme
MQVTKAIGPVPESCITLTDISLKDIKLETLPLLKGLRDEHFNTEPEFCLELPCAINLYLRKFDVPKDSAELRAGKINRFVLKTKKAVFPNKNLLAGTTTSKNKGVLVHPHILATSTVWPELETISRRKMRPFAITRADIETLNQEILPFWRDRTIIELTRAEFHNPPSLDLMQRIIFFVTSKVVTLSHVIPDYAVVVDKGLKVIAQEAGKKAKFASTREERDFYQAVQFSLEGVLDYARRLSDEAYLKAQQENDPKWRAQLLEMSQVCRRVPASPPQTFREAVNAVWLCHVALHQENVNVAISPGRLDQVLYPAFSQELEHCRTVGGKAGEQVFLEEAVELVGCLWLKLCDHIPAMPEGTDYILGGSGCNQAVTLGGVDREGNLAVNDLTYVILRATELLRLRDPNVNARYHPEVREDEAQDNRQYLERLCDVNVNTGATPCFHNDLAAIETLHTQKAQKINLKDARDYGSVGCVEPTNAGRTFGHTGALLLNLPAVLDLALFQGKHRLTGLGEKDDRIGLPTPPPETFTSFSELQQAFEAQLECLISQAVTLNNYLGKIYQRHHPFPLLSALIKGCLEKGQDVIQGGARYNSSGVAIIGLAEVVDSLTVLEDFVFQKETVTLAEMLEAIKHNWEGHEKLLARVRKFPDRFGGYGPLAQKNAKWLMRFLHESFQSHKNYRGGPYTVGYWTLTMHAGFGPLTEAMPSGRKAGESLPSGITPISWAAPPLNDVMRFVAGLDHTHIANGQALNLKYTPPLHPYPDFIKDFSDSINAYFKMGGLQVQFNVIDRKTFREAQRALKIDPHDPSYQDLFVRVSGYSAYFKDLDSRMQDEIITRAQYDLDTGDPVPSTAAYPPAAWPGPRDILARVALKGGLRFMKLILWLKSDFRAMLGTFSGTYLFFTRTGTVNVPMAIEKGTIRFLDSPLAIEDADVALEFKDGRALWEYLKMYATEDERDILVSVARDKVRPHGNLNYIFKFAFMVNHLLLWLSGWLPQWKSAGH